MKYGDPRTVLAGLWVALVLTGLWGDMLRMYAGDFKPGEILGMQPSQAIWLGIAVFMLIPIVMVVLNLTLAYPAIRWASIIVAAVFFVFNLIGLPTYSLAYGKFLALVGFVQHCDCLVCMEVGALGPSRTSCEVHGEG